jgi:hypothetical protein
MPPEYWLVLSVGAAFLLLGVAGSPLAWVALLHRRSQSERRAEGRWLDLENKLRALEVRVKGSELATKTDSRDGEFALSDASLSRRAGKGRSALGTTTRHDPKATSPAGGEAALIAVPSLPGAHVDREATANGIKERYAAIWTLAETGAAPDVIARATGQPIGQIELILGLRRQIQGTRTTIGHAPRT